MYHRKEKKSDFLQVHEAAAKLSGSPSALYVLSAELGWGLWLQISSPGAARSMEGMLGIPPVSLCSHQGGGTGGWQRGCSSEGAARTGACSGDKCAAPPCRLTVFPGHGGGSIRKIRMNYQVMLVQKEWIKRAGFLFCCSTIPFAWDFWVGALFSYPVSPGLWSREKWGGLAGFAAKDPSNFFLCYHAADDWVFSLKARVGLGDRSHPSSFDNHKRKPSVSCRVQLDTQISAAILLPHHGVAQHTVLLLWDLETPKEHSLGYHISDLPEKGEIFVSNVELIGELSTEEILELNTPFLAHLDCPP